MKRIILALLFSASILAGCSGSAPTSGTSCVDSSSCSGATPLCKADGYGHRSCQAATSTQDCIDSLVPSPNTQCLTYTVGAGGECTAGTLTTPSGNESDGCCPAGATATDDIDCKCNSNTDCTDADKPICDATASMCRPANDQADCDALVPASNTMCESYTYNAGKCDKGTLSTLTNGDGCCPTGGIHSKDDDCADECTVATQGTDCTDPMKSVCKDDGSGKMTCQAAPATCTDSTTDCTDSAKPICDTGTHACRAANDQADCDALVPASNTMCVSYTYNAGKCDKGTLSTLTNGDGCCPAGGIHSKDNDCADECTVATQSTDCSSATPVCKDDGSGKMTCQAAPATCTDSTTDCTDAGKPICDTGTHACRAANDQAECNTLVPASNTMCESYTYNAGKCDKGTLSTLTNGDGCCPSGGIHSKDNDCANECTVATQSTDCSSATPVCKDDGSGKMTCQAAPATTCNSNTDCTDIAKPICKEDASMTKVCQAPLDVKIGDGCKNDGDCGTDGTCIVETADGNVKGGYCVTKVTSCTDDEKWCTTNVATGSETFKCVTDFAGQTGDMCVRACTGASDCRPGYKCDAAKSICVPNVIEFKPGKAGQSCKKDDECGTDPRIECKLDPKHDTWRNGYCLAKCDTASGGPDVCPTGTECVNDQCLKVCDNSYHRWNYQCEIINGSTNKVAWTKPGVGGACTDDGKVGGKNNDPGTCQMNTSTLTYTCKSDMQFKGGYCVGSGSCPAGSATLNYKGSTGCYQTCTGDPDCARNGTNDYTCQNMSGNNFCLPKP